MRITTAVLAGLILAGGASLPAHAQTTLKLGHVSSADNVYHLGALRFAERVSSLTNGSVKVDALCCAQLGNDVAQAKTVQLGAQDLAIVSSNNLAQFYAPIDIFSMPALFEDIPSAQKAVFGPVGAEIFENFRKATGMRVVYTTAWGSRSMINNKRSITKPDDLKELDEELSSIQYEERPSFGPELEAELADVQQRRETLLPELIKLRDMASDGRKVLLPLLEREIPLVADEWANTLDDNDTGSKSSVETMPRMAPTSRISRTRARVSISEIPQMPFVAR